MEDLPVLGYPMKPTEICLRDECRAENWRRSEIRDPFPNELLIEAWNARVGYSLPRRRTQLALIQSQYHEYTNWNGTHIAEAEKQEKYRQKKKRGNKKQKECSKRCVDHN